VKISSQFNQDKRTNIEQLRSIKGTTTLRLRNLNLKTVELWKLTLQR